MADIVRCEGTFMRTRRILPYLAFTAILALSVRAVPLSLAALEEVRETAPAAWQGGDKTGGVNPEKDSPEIPAPVKVFRPAQLPPGVIPAKAPVLYPRNQKVRVVPPHAMKLADSIVKVYPRPFPTPVKTVQPAAVAVKPVPVVENKRAS